MEAPGTRDGRAGGQRAAPEPAASAPEPEASAEPAETAGGRRARTTETAAAGGGGFDRTVALKALAKNAAAASRCRMRGENAGYAEVAVTFGTSGTVENAVVTSGPFVGSPTGKCVTKRLSTSTIPSFSGESQTVITTVTVH